MKPYVFLFLMLSSSLVFADIYNEDQVEPSVDMGSEVYYERCSICHGASAVGDGLIPLKIKDYPDTSLLKFLETADKDSLRLAVVYGGSEGAMSNFMPPMGNDLTWTQTESVIQFLLLFKNNYDEAVAMVRNSAANLPSTKKQGRQLFSAQCVLCHGKNGDGKGRMAKILKTPPPANLIVSRLPDDYLRKIIGGGGQSVGRSPNMPPWGEQLSKNELESIILYIKSIRN